MKNIAKISLLVIFLLSLALVACKKAEEPAVTEQTAVEENNMAMPEVAAEATSTETAVVPVADTTTATTEAAI